MKDSEAQNTRLQHLAFYRLRDEEHEEQSVSESRGDSRDLFSNLSRLSGL